MKALPSLLAAGLLAGCATGNPYQPPTGEVWAFKADPVATTRSGETPIVVYALGSEAVCEQARIATAAQVAKMMMIVPGPPPGRLGPCQRAWLTAGTGWWGFSVAWLGMLTTTEAGCRRMRQQLSTNLSGHAPSACAPVSLQLGGRS